MAEGRMLKRRITMSRKMAAVKTDKAKLLWFYMLPFTDIEGRIDADPDDIRDAILRKQRKGYTCGTIQKCLEDLHQAGLVHFYVVNGRQYLEFSRFADEQNLNPKREAKSTIPAPLTEYSGVLQRDRVKLSKVKLSKVKLSKVKLSEVNNNTRAREKRTFIEFVKMTEAEHKRLIARLGQDTTAEYVERLNNYIGSKGKQYKSHYHTILDWSSKDGQRRSKADTRGNESSTETKPFIR